MMRLGIMTCQRGSDMVEMGPEHRNGHGLLSRPKKTKKRRRAFMIPLTTADALELDRWAETPVTFTNSRWKQPIQRFREDLYLCSPKGAQYTPDGLRARYGRWLADTPEGKQLCKRWKEWVAGQVKKYFWDIDPEDADHPTIHGLRGTGILARAEQGLWGRPDRQRHRHDPPERRALHAIPRPDEGRCRRQEAAAPGHQRGLDRERRPSYMGVVRGADLQDCFGSLKTSEKNSEKSSSSLGNGVTVAYRISG
jgi:hypothetical protein